MRRTVRFGTKPETYAAYLRIGDRRRPCRFGDVALLFRGMGDVPAYEDAFKRYDIAYRVTSSRGFEVVTLTPPRGVTGARPNSTGSAIAA